MATNTLPIVLGSSSPFRRELLQKLHLDFTWDSPDIDESPLTGESPKDMVLRLAIAKANALAGRHPNALIIASDQVGLLGEQVLTKPLNFDTAKAQLKAASGKAVTFLTSLCLLNTQTSNTQSLVSLFKVHFLELSDTQIEAYIKKEEPYQCAGSFKSEGLGITLFSKLEGHDPNSLIGLPLIELIAMLRHEGIEPLS